MKIVGNTLLDICDALTTPELSFSTLRELRPKMSHYGNYITYARGNAITFLAHLNEEPLAVKCYLNPRTNPRLIASDPSVATSPLLLPFNFYEEELQLGLSALGSHTRLDILTTPWLREESLARAIRLAQAADDRRQFATLANRFDRFALQLLDAPFAHGDIKPENILLTDDETMQLIDIDAIWLPTLTRCEEIGTAGYQHPLRNESHFGADIDDYPIALLTVALHALSELALETDPTTLLPIESSVATHPTPTYQEIVAHLRNTHNRPLLHLAEQLRSQSPAIDGLRDALTELVDNHTT